MIITPFGAIKLYADDVVFHYDNEQIKADFNELYHMMNGMPLREMDKIIYPVCTLCRDHEKAGFVEGVKLGIRLSGEIAKE